MFAPRSAYLHIPFCHRRCFYCDFAVVPLGDQASAAAGAPGAASIAAYLKLLQREIDATPAGAALSTVYLGGGTPSLLNPEQVRELLGSLRRRHGLAPGAEISLELDPASFDQQRLAGYLAAGVNRISLGGQSFDDGVLLGLGRRHSSTDLEAAIGWLSQAQSQGQLHSWSLDLIEAVPGQSLADWEQQLQRAIASNAPHLSIYALTLETGTVFGKRAERGQLELPDDELAADLHECTSQVLRAAGYGHYEISNYALPGHGSRHNRTYWSGADWWAYGLGATSCQGGIRHARPRTREAYAAWVAELEQQAGHEQQEWLAGAQPNPGMPFDERLLVGLRRREGIDLARLLLQAGIADPRPLLLELQQHMQLPLEQGLLLIEGNRWRLSDPEGLALSNAVLRDLLRWWECVASAPTA